MTQVGFVVSHVGTSVVEGSTQQILDVLMFSNHSINLTTLEGLSESPNIVSRRMRDSLSGVTGIRFYPVNILDKKLEVVDIDYYGFHITGRCGPFIKSLSRSERGRLIPTGPEIIKKMGLYFDPVIWDGSDFFLAEGTLFRLLSKKAHDIIKSNGFTDIRMESIVDVETVW